MSVDKKKMDLLNSHKDAASKVKNMAVDMIEKIQCVSDDDTNNAAVLGKLDKASSALHKICSVLKGLIPIERALNDIEEELTLNNEDIEKSHITENDCLMVINLVREWGLLKEDQPIDIKQIMQRYHR